MSYDPRTLREVSGWLSNDDDRRPRPPHGPDVTGFSPDEEAAWDLAEEIARRAHRGQKRRYTREPYLHHPLRVAELVQRAGGEPRQIQAAVLHDVIEDTRWTAKGLRLAGVDPYVVYLVVSLSRSPDEAYRAYVQRVARSDDQRLIKRADVLDNMATLPEGDQLWLRYIQALRYLAE